MLGTFLLSNGHGHKATHKIFNKNRQGLDGSLADKLGMRDAFSMPYIYYILREDMCIYMNGSRLFMTDMIII